MKNVFGKEYNTWEERGEASVYSKSREAYFPINYAFLEDARSYNPEQSAKELTQPLLVVQGDADTTVQDSRQWFDNATSVSSKKLVTIDGANHTYAADRDLEQVIEEIVLWFKETL